MVEAVLILMPDSVMVEISLVIAVAYLHDGGVGTSVSIDVRVVVMRLADGCACRLIIIIIDQACTHIQAAHTQQAKSWLLTVAIYKVG
jgi:hypothetical protein